MRKVAAILLILVTTFSVAAARRNSDAAAFRTAVKSELRDPNATIDATTVHKEAVCGTVEAKNSSGGNTGRMLFVYVQSEKKAYVLGGPSDTTSQSVNAAIAAYQEHCQH